MARSARNRVDLIAALGIAAFVLAGLPAVATTDVGPGPSGWIDDLAAIGADDWNYARAAHLLERAGFGGTPEEIEALAAMTPRDAVRHLVRYQEVEPVELRDFPAVGIYPSEDFVPGHFEDHLDRVREEAMRDGSSMALGIEIPYDEDNPAWIQPLIDQFYFLVYANGMEGRRGAGWIAERMVLTNRPLQEKLALFWHGHFATEDNKKVLDYRKLMNQWELFRENGNGNYGELLLAIARDPAMLMYLDGRSNVKGHPNENFSREILELFSLGVGNYSEEDIQEAARAFTGLQLRDNRFFYNEAEHDFDEKTFLGRTGNFDTEDVVEIILQQDACAEFVSRKLYRFFVREEISPELNAELAAILRDNGYDVATLLEAIFLSRDFYSSASYATQIKGPVQLAVSTYRKLGLSGVPRASRFSLATGQLGQTIFHPPNVAGWKGGRTWINPSTLIDRQNFVRRLLFPGEARRAAAAATGGSASRMANVMGRESLEEMRQMEARGDTTSFPGQNSEDGNKADRFRYEEYNLFRGVYNGSRSLRQLARSVPPDPPVEIDVTALVRGAGVTTADEAVAYLEKRFFRASLGEPQIAAIADFLEQRIGTSEIDFDRPELETDLRETLHLLLSAPEYQLA